MNLNSTGNVRIT